MKRPRVLLVDLNNFARYPTIAVGYLTSILRASGASVSVLSPLAHGVPGIPREPPETRFLDAARRLSYSVRYAPGRAARVVKRSFDRARVLKAGRKHEPIAELVARQELRNFDVVLVSTYLIYHDVCASIGELCRRAGVPLIIGGSYFANAEVARAWLDLPGLTALVGGEVEPELAELVMAAAAGQDLARFAGVWLPDGRGGPRPPLKDLDALPFPDYSDFPWHAYPNRIVPLITGRGCGWGVCSFCSDVTSTAGRSFRSRSAHNVLAEIGYQAEKYGTSLFAFTDLKLNSEPEVWSGLIDGIASKAHKPRWIGAVHVGSRQPHHLDAGTLRAAHRAGLVRLTTGLESGSQRVLDRLKKGTDLATTSRFLTDAAAVGISVRVTMIHGSPGEEAEDVLASAAFLERHRAEIDRVSLNRFQLMIGPSFLERYTRSPDQFPSIRNVVRKPVLAQAEHDYRPGSTPAYFRATQRLLSAVHAINKKPLRPLARSFDGVM